VHLSFPGGLECHRYAGPAGVTLVGRTTRGDTLHLSLLGAMPEDLPARLEAAELERVDAEHYRISSNGRAWVVPAKPFLHYDLSAAFYAALPPRRVPLRKRLFWRLLLAAARTPPIRSWLARSGSGTAHR
jgi:hypothetical protein